MVACMQQLQRGTGFTDTGQKMSGNCRKLLLISRPFSNQPTNKEGVLASVMTAVIVVTTNVRHPGVRSVPSL